GRVLWGAGSVPRPRGAGTAGLRISGRDSGPGRSAAASRCDAACRSSESERVNDESDEIRSTGGGGGTEIAVGSGGDETSLPAIPDSLPVLPLKNTVLFPHLLSPLLVNTDRSRRLIDEVLRSPERLLVCVAVKRPVESSPGPDDLHRVGTVMRIAKMLKFPDDSYRLLVQGVARAAVDGFASEQPFLVGRVRRLDDT